MRETVRFKGFRSPNYTQVPDELFDELLADVSGAELKVLLYVMRRTFGFKKGSDRISKSQLETGITRTNGQVLDRGTGLSRRAIRLAVQSLVTKNILLKKTNFSGRHGHEATEYALNIIGSTPWVQTTPGGVRGRVESTPGHAHHLRADARRKSTQALGRGVPPQDTGDKKDVDVRTISRNEDGVASLASVHDTIALRRSRGARSTSGPPSDRVAYLTDALADACSDHKPISLHTFRVIAERLGESATWQLISLMNEAQRDGLIKRATRGAYLVGMAKQIAKQRGVDLGFRPTGERRLA
jgi:phage replication O-like protein O